MKRKRERGQEEEQRVLGNISPTLSISTRNNIDIGFISDGNLENYKRRSEDEGYGGLTLMIYEKNSSDGLVWRWTSVMWAMNCTYRGLKKWVGLRISD